MKCRRNYKEENEKQTIIYFGSHGRTQTTETVTQYASACALVKKVTKMNLRGITETIQCDRIMIFIPCKIESHTDITFTFPHQVSTAYWTGIYNAKNDDLYNIGSSGDAFTTKTFTLHQSDIDGFVLYLNEVTLEDCLNCKITFTRRRSNALFTSDKKSFAETQEAVACSLTQRLNLIKGELWYQINEGLPLFEKNVSVTSMDAWIIRTIMKHPDVVSILSFTSTLVGHKYSADCKILSKYGELDLSI